MSIKSRRTSHVCTGPNWTYLFEDWNVFSNVKKFSGKMKTFADQKMAMTTPAVDTTLWNISYLKAHSGISDSTGTSD